MDQNRIIEITTIEELMEITGVGGVHGGVGGASISTKKEEKKSQKEVKMKSEQIFRKYIRNKLSDAINEQKKEELELRKIVSSILKEGDISDTHPHRSTGINVLEDVLKKSIPTLRIDYKKLTTDKKQRDSFRAHIVKAVLDSLKPSQVNSAYLSGSESGGSSSLLSEPTGAGEEEQESDEDFLALEEAEIEIDVDEEPEEGEKKIPVEADDTPSEEEAFGGGLEGLDETGRNTAYTSYRKISQYVLDAFDSLANPKDQEIYTDYLVTNLKLYFDKFEDEIAATVEEPSTPEYDAAVS
tara:strand:+ start:711 stop:1604 length:894 start_codon:yes stop_codon:yes gene_type:complete